MNAREKQDRASDWGKDFAKKSPWQLAVAMDLLSKSRQVTIDEADHGFAIVHTLGEGLWMDWVIEREDARGRKNKTRERIWFSPSCLKPIESAQQQLFGGQK